MIKSGYILIDKPAGLTSHRVVEILRKQFNISKIGHTGTLDPFATGLLVLGINEALKFINYLHEEPKVYEATLKLGKSTDTLDKEGKTIAEVPVPPLAQATLSETFLKFLGKQEQMPPMYSARKQKGKKLYELARQGIEVERKPTAIEIFDLTWGNQNESPLPLWERGEISFRVSCSRGTYVRVLGADIAKALGTVGHLTALRRLQAGPFDVANAFPLQTGDWKDIHLIPTPETLSHMPRIDLTVEETDHVQHGRKITKENLPSSSFYRLFFNDQFLGVGELKEGHLIPVRLLVTGS